MERLAHLEARMRRRATRRLLVISGIVCVAIAAVMFGTSGRFSLAAIADRCGQPAPDVRVATSPEGVQSFLDACGEAGRSAYRDLQLLDLVYPLAIGLFLATALALTIPRALPGARRPIGALAVVPLLAAGADYLENVGAWIVLNRYPDVPRVAAALYGIASPAKQVLNWIAVPALILFAGVALVRWAARVVARVVARRRADRPVLTGGAPLR